MIPFPDISPEIFSFELFGINFALRWYAVSYILGFICALKLMKYFVVRKILWSAEKSPLSEDQADTFLTYLILGVIIGGRLGYVLFYNLEYFALNPLSALRYLGTVGMVFSMVDLSVVILAVSFVLLV